MALLKACDLKKFLSMVMMIGTEFSDIFVYDTKDRKKDEVIGENKVEREYWFWSN
jgi:hypothetical protein